MLRDQDAGGITTSPDFMFNGLGKLLRPEAVTKKLKKRTQSMPLMLLMPAHASDPPFWMGALRGVGWSRLATLASRTQGSNA